MQFGAWTTTIEHFGGVFGVYRTLRQSGICLASKMGRRWRTLWAPVFNCWARMGRTPHSNSQPSPYPRRSPLTRSESSVLSWLAGTTLSCWQWPPYPNCSKCHRRTFPCRSTILCASHENLTAIYYLHGLLRAAGKGIPAVVEVSQGTSKMDCASRWKAENRSSFTSCRPVHHPPHHGPSESCLRVERQNWET